jgi:hypothetical protein
MHQLCSKIVLVFNLTRALYMSILRSLLIQHIQGILNEGECSVQLTSSLR